MLHSSVRVAVGLFALLCAGSARAVQVYYEVESLGGNRWVYAYQLDRFPYDAGYGFSVFFDPDLYGAIATETPGPGPAWSALVVQPDTGLGAEGFYDAEAVSYNSTHFVTFRVSFDWLGAGPPGDQPFEVREPSPSFAAIESGTTIAPEPAALAQHAITALSIAALAIRGRSRC